MIKKGDEKLDLFDLLEATELLLASRLPFSVDPHDYNATDSDFLRMVADDMVELN
jgi:hypothetical protein